MKPFILRPLEMTDAEIIFRHLRDGEVGKYLSELPSPYTLQDAEGFIALNKMAASPFTNNRAIALRKTNELIGVIGLKNYDRREAEAELGFWLAKPYWGRGIISGVIEDYVEWSFKEVNLKSIYARVFEPNIASIKALERNGFVPEEGYTDESCNKQVNAPMLKFIKKRGN